MPITLFLAGQALLEVIEIMSAAFVAACDALHLKISDPAARFVAEKVIELAQRGIHGVSINTERACRFPSATRAEQSFRNIVGFSAGRSPPAPHPQSPGVEPQLL